jgi:hypothetical protein
MTMTDQTEQPDEDVRVLDGPDPRAWDNGDIGRACADVEAVLRVQGLRKGGNAYGNTHDAAGRLLDSLMDAAQAQLAVALLTAYGVPVPERDGEPDFPFSGAGKPRAFGMATAREDIVAGPLDDHGKPA